MPHPPKPVVPEVSPWEDDWLYTLVLAEAARPRANRQAMIDEYDRADGCFCRGKVVRTWFAASSGLRLVTADERKGLRLKLRGKPVYPYVIHSFHIWRQ